MSTHKGFDLTNTFSDILFEKKSSALPQSNGALVDLVQLAYPPSNFSPDMTDAQTLDAVGSMLSALFNDDVPVAGALLQGELNGLCDDLSVKLDAHIQHARSVVAPLVCDLANKYHAYLEQLTPKNPGSQFSIVAVKPAGVLADGMFLDELKYIEGRKIPVPDGISGGALVPYEELVQRLLEADSAAVAGVQEWLVNKPEGWLEGLWIQLFCSSTQGKAIGAVGGVDVASLVPGQAADVGLALYLWSKYLYKNPSALGGETLAKHQERLSHMIDYGAQLLMTNIRRIALANSTKALLLRYDQGTHTAYVNGDLYAGWLESGGCPEVILGMISSGNMLTNISLIDERSRDFIKRWEQYVMVYTAKEMNNRHLYSRRALLEMFNQSLNVYVQEERDIRQNESYFAATRVKQASIYLDSLTTKQLEDVNAVSLYLVAKLRFNYTSAYEMLLDMQEAQRINPAIEPREAAYLASMNYLGDFLAQQIALKVF